MSTDLIHKAVVSQFISETFERFSGEHLHHLLTEDFHAHPWAGAGIPDGPGGMARVAAFLGEKFSNARVVVHDLLAEGDRVVARYTFEADHTGELAGTAPTGRRIRLPGILIARLRDGKIAEYWREEDQLGMLAQIGAVAAPAF